MHAQNELVTMPQHRPVLLQGLGSVQKPISAYKHHASISFSAINEFMTSCELWTPNQLKIQEMRQAICSYQNDVAQQIQLPVSDICWFYEWPFVTLSPRLSASVSLASPECRCSATIGHIALRLECYFLLVEYETLASASVPHFKPAVQPILDVLSAEPRWPQPPDAAALAHVRMRCGTNQRMHAEPLVRGLLEPLLQRYKRLLPLEKWRAVCMQCRCVAQAVVDEHNWRMVQDEEGGNVSDQVLVASLLL
jgi:hypothetical protein